MGGKEHNKIFGQKIFENVVMVRYRLHDLLASVTVTFNYLKN